MKTLDKRYKFQNDKWSRLTGISQDKTVEVTRVAEGKVYFIVIPDDGYGETYLYLNEFKEALKNNCPDFSM